MIYSVEELHQSYNDWYEAIWIDEATFEEAVEKAITCDHYRVKITQWKNGKREEEWNVVGDEIQITCSECFQERDKSTSIEKEGKPICEDCKDGYEIFH